MRETGKYLTLSEMLFFEHMQVYFVPDIATLGVGGVQNTKFWPYGHF